METRQTVMSSAAAGPEAGFGAGRLTLADAGEDEVLRRLRAVAASAGAPAGLVLGPGDDAAVWAPPPGLEVALTQDALVEDRDFRRAWITPRGLGRRAATVAISDLAAMGASPAWCMATLCAPGGTSLEDVLEIQRGLVTTARAAGCAVAGGDLSDIPGPLVIDVAAAGTAPPGRWLRRDAGRPGDMLLLTGSLGGAAAGLRALMGDAAGAAAGVSDVVREAWSRALLAPRARVAEGSRLAAAGVRCAGDLSDGLLVDAARTATASGCAAELWLEAIPVAAGVRDAFPDAWVDLALAGGEDFELLVSAPPRLAAGLAADWPRELAPLHVVGRLTAGAGVLLLTAEGGGPLPLPRTRSRHWA